MKMRSVYVLLGLLMFAPHTFAHEDGVHIDWKADGNSKAVKLQQCVEATDVMRRDHMKFLLHQRDETMHKGIRTRKHSLVNCIDCHVNKDKQGQFVPVNSKGQFCQSCHAFAGVTMDCFQCHATKPRSSAGAQSAATSAMKKTAVIIDPAVQGWFAGPRK